MAFLGGFVKARLRKAELDQIDALTRDFPEIYDSRAHFLRASVIRELRRVQKDIRRTKENDT